MQVLEANRTAKRGNSRFFDTDFEKLDCGLDERTANTLARVTKPKKLRLKREMLVLAHCKVVPASRVYLRQTNYFGGTRLRGLFGPLRSTQSNRKAFYVPGILPTKLNATFSPSNWKCGRIHAFASYHPGLPSTSVTSIFASRSGFLARSASLAS